MLTDNAVNKQFDFFFAFPPDLSNCKLINFPDGVFKILKSVLENIHAVTLADNVMKVISSKFFSSFTHLQGTCCFCSFEWLMWLIKHKKRENALNMFAMLSVLCHVIHEQNLLNLKVLYHLYLVPGRAGSALQCSHQTARCSG